MTSLAPTVQVFFSDRLLRQRRRDTGGVTPGHVLNGR